MKKVFLQELARLLRLFTGGSCVFARTTLAGFLFSVLCLTNALSSSLESTLWYLSKFIKAGVASIKVKSLIWEDLNSKIQYNNWFLNSFNYDPAKITKHLKNLPRSIKYNSYISIVIIYFYQNTIFTLLLSSQKVADFYVGFQC